MSVGKLPTRQSVSPPRDIRAFPYEECADCSAPDRVDESRQIFHDLSIASVAAIHYHFFSPEIHAHHPPVARSGGPGVRRGFFCGRRTLRRRFPHHFVELTRQHTHLLLERRVDRLRFFAVSPEIETLELSRLFRRRDAG